MNFLARVLIWTAFALGTTLAASRAQVVTLTDSGPTVTLANGLISAVITKSNGKCTDLRLTGGNNLLANGGQFYFDANGSVNGGSSVYVAFSGDVYRVVTNTSARTEIAITDTNLTGFNAELHYTLRAGDCGLYVHTVWRHGPGNPTATLEQSRMVLRCDPNVFTHAYSSSNKIGQMIEPALLNTAVSPQIMDATYQLPAVSSYTNETGFTEDGFPVYTKYDWCDYLEHQNVTGLSSETTGLWMIFGSVEYFNGGPTKANLLLHGTDTTPLLLWDFHAQHFGGSTITKSTNVVWDKIMGPCFIYLNNGANTLELWNDAQSRATSEKAAWPYDWVVETNYPVARGTIRGRLHVLSQSTGNALLVLCQPGGYWQLQSEGYQFWTRAAADGSFEIPKIRPGNYTLYARVPGLVGEYALANVEVLAGQTKELGVLEWFPPRREHRLWRIGTPDLSAAEFRFGDRMRQFGLWWRYLEEQGTNDLVYRIGDSMATNWYYAQSVVAMDDGSYFSPTWRVEFAVSNLPPSPAALTIDLAGGIGGTLLTTVNGTSLANLGITNDGSIYRSATQSGMARHFELVFNTNLLHVGTNVISFSLSKSSTPWTNSSSTKPVQPSRGVMWDCVQLEAGALIDVATPRFSTVQREDNQLVFVGTGGFPDGHYRLLRSPVASLPPASWELASLGVFDGNGDFTLKLSIVPDEPRQFYRLQLP